MTLAIAVSVNQALKARNSKTLGSGRKRIKPCKGDTTGCFALAGLSYLSTDTQGSGAARLHPGLSCPALSALDTTKLQASGQKKLTTVYCLQPAPPGIMLLVQFIYPRHSIENGVRPIRKPKSMFDQFIAYEIQIRI
jgi:hypothetical protein